MYLWILIVCVNFTIFINFGVSLFWGFCFVCFYGSKAMVWVYVLRAFWKLYVAYTVVVVFFLKYAGYMYSVVLSAGNLFFCSTGSYQWLCYSIPWVGWTYLLSELTFAVALLLLYLKDLGYSLNSKWAVLVIVNNNKWGGGAQGTENKIKTENIDK